MCIASITALYFSIHRDSFPKLELDVISITAYHNEPDANEALEKITIPLEERIHRFDGIKEILSLSSKGFADLLVTLEGDHHADEILAEIRSADDLPYAEIEAVRAGTTQGPAIGCVFTSSYHDGSDLQGSVADIKRWLEELKIVYQVRSFGLESDVKAKHRVNVRYNGKSAIELMVYKKAQVDLIKAKNQLEKHIQSFSKSHDLSYKILAQNTDHVARRLKMILWAGVVGLSFFVTIGYYLSGRVALGYGIAIVFALSTSLLILKLMGVNVDMTTSLFILLLFGLNFAVVSFLSDRAGKQSISGLSAGGFPVMCVVISVLVSAAALSSFSGIMAKLFVFIQKTIIILTIVPPIIYFFFTPALSIFKNDHRRGIAGRYHKLVDKYLNHNRIAIVMVLALTGVTIFFTFKALTRGSFTFFPKSESNRITVDLAGPVDSKVLSAVEKIESTISSRTDLRDFKSYIGLKNSSSNDFEIDYSENVAQVNIRLVPDVNIANFTDELKSVGLEAGISSEIHHGSQFRSNEIEVQISGDNLQKLLEAVADFQYALSEVKGVENVITDYAPDKIQRKNSKQVITISADHDPISTSRRQVYQTLHLKKPDYPGLLVEFDEDDAAKQGDIKIFGRSLLYATGILILLHIVITVYLRSILHLLIPLGPVYLFAGAASITNEFSSITFFSIIGLSFVFSSEILFFLQLLKSIDRPQLSVHAVALKCAVEKFNSTLLIFFSLFPVAILMLYGDSVLRDVGFAFCGGLIFQLIFSLMVLPALAKFELQLKRKMGLTIASKPYPNPP